MCFEGVVDVEGGVGHKVHVAFAGGGEEMEIGVLGGADVVREGRTVGLDRLWTRLEGCVGC